MWKATIADTNQAKIKESKQDEWETDPDYVNSISEKEQRWGNHDSLKQTENPVNLAQLREQVISKNDTKSKESWNQRYGQDMKSSYGLKQSKKEPHSFAP